MSLHQPIRRADLATLAAQYHSDMPCTREEWEKACQYAVDGDWADFDYFLTMDEAYDRWTAWLWQTGRENSERFEDEFPQWCERNGL